MNEIYRDMNLKEYQEQPSDGLFEKISRRLMWRRVATVAAGCVALGAVVVAAALLLPRQTQQEMPTEQAVVAVQTEQAVAPQQDIILAPQSEAVAVKADGMAATSVAAVPEMQTITALDNRDERASVAAMPATESTHGETADAIAEAMPVQPAHAKLPAVSAPVETAGGTQFRDVPEETRPAGKGGVPTTPETHYDNLVWAPNVVIPDGENDEVRLFRVILNSDVSDYHLYIYNRNGRQVYKTQDHAATWDATLDGMRLPQGAYVWVAKFRDADGMPRAEKGTVTVVR